MLDPMQYGFLVGRHLSETREKSAVNLGGIGKLFGGAASAAGAAKPAVPAATAAATAARPAAAAAGAVPSPSVAGGQVPHFMDTQARLAQTRGALAANPHAKMPGEPIKMAPPLTARQAAQLPSPPPPKPVPGKATSAPQNLSTQQARMFYDNAASTGQNQMLGYGQRGGPSSVPRSWDQLTPEQQATVMRSLGIQ